MICQHCDELQELIPVENRHTWQLATHETTSHAKNFEIRLRTRKRLICIKRARKVAIPAQYNLKANHQLPLLPCLLEVRPKNNMQFKRSRVYRRCAAIGTVLRQKIRNPLNRSSDFSCGRHLRFDQREADGKRMRANFAPLAGITA